MTACLSEWSHKWAERHSQVRRQPRRKTLDIPALRPDRPAALSKGEDSPLLGAAGTRFPGKARGSCLQPAREGWGPRHCRAWQAGDPGCPSCRGRGQGQPEVSGLRWAAPVPQRRTGRSGWRGWQRSQGWRGHGLQALRSSWAQLVAPEAPQRGSGWSSQRTGSPR